MAKIITTRKCTACRTEKSLAEFYKNKADSTAGRQYICKDCSRERRSGDAGVKQHGTMAAYNNGCRCESCSSEMQSYTASYRAKNKSKVRTANKRWIEKHKAHRREYQNLYFKQRVEKDPQFKLSLRLRQRLHSALKNNRVRNYKDISSIRDLGCTVAELKSYLESQFKPGMTWDNWAKDGWHIDHIKPLASFDLSNREETLKAVHYTNLQPLWAVENLRKGAQHG